MGFVGRDFHFDVKVLAGYKIEDVKVNIQQRNGETYAKVWSHEVVWPEYRNAKNANVHKHFLVPKDAVEGKYDFIITINDQNGTKLEVKKNFTIIDPLNFPVDPVLYDFGMFVNGEVFRSYRLSGPPLLNPEGLVKNGDVIKIGARFNGVKDNGKMYILLINKKFKHRPESIADIDFAKVIVYDVYEHHNLSGATRLSNTVLGPKPIYPVIRKLPDLVIGSAFDNNIPANAIAGDKAWESGDYYFGVIYQNTTYNIGVFNYLEFKIDIN